MDEPTIVAEELRVINDLLKKALNRLVFLDREIEAQRKKIEDLERELDARQGRIDQLQKEVEELEKSIDEDQEWKIQGGGL